MKLKNSALILFGAVAVIVLGDQAIRWSSKDYKLVLLTANPQAGPG